MNLESMLRQAMENRESSDSLYRPQCTDEELILQLREYADILFTKHEFKVGDIIRKKRGIPSQYRIPAHNNLAIVTRTDIDHIRVSAKRNTNHDGEHEDLEIFFLDHDGGFIRLTVDSRWFEPYKP